MQDGQIREDSPERSASDKDNEESFDLLVSKHLIPPPRMLLPKPQIHKPKSLLPMLPLPAFVGIIPNFQPLDKPIRIPKIEKDNIYNWIGDAFDNVVYRRYDQESYKKIENADQYWNLWACDVSKLTNRKSADPQTPQQQLVPFYTLKNPKDKTLIFESRFQCGNLSLVSKVTDNEYNLLLQNDINTNGYSQWFFFKVSNTRANQKVRFNILNQYKQNNLYKMGMKIIIYSKKHSQQKNISWHRGGEDIQYFQNGYSRSTHQYKPYFTLSWSYHFQYPEDQVYFAYSYPFTYTNLQSFIHKIESDVYMRNICHRSPLCKTLAGNVVDVFTITQQHQLDVDKGYIIITARLHPGQSVSSYVCNGIMQFLLSNDQKAIKLRRNFIFKIIPMINPDGVIHGNYRSNISGYDLNKKWMNPSKIYHPQIFYLKKLVLNIQEIGNVLLFCDLHGHSMKKNAFVYGCHDRNNPKNGKQFPLLMSKLFKGFSFKDCCFIDKDQEEGTSRTFLSNELRHCDVFALQSSFCGPEHQNIHFTVRHFEELGEKFCQSLLMYFKDKINQMHVQAAMRAQANFPIQENNSFDVQGLEQFGDQEFLQNLSLQDRVNSDNSQLSQFQNQQKVILQERIVKKYLMMKYARPGTHLKRSNILIRRSQSKDLMKMKLGDFLPKSNSPVKRRQLYESPAKIQRPKNNLKIAIQKKQIQAKLFEPVQIVQAQNKKRKVKLTIEQEKILKSTDRAQVKVVLNKNFQFNEKQEEPQPIFKNNFLKGLAKEQVRSQRRASDFIIRKKIPYDDKSSVSLFNSVLASLRKQKK